MSLARQHYLRKTAAVANPTAAASPIYANAYELQLIALADAKRALKQVQSVERKAEVKRRVLPQFQDWIAGVLEAGKPGQDDVLMTCMVWQIDVGDFDAALKSAAHALAHGLTLPDRYKRDVSTLVAEEIAEQSLTALVSGRQVDLQSLAEADRLTASRDMPDEVRAKLHKALGLGYLAAAALDSAVPSRLDMERAEHHLQRAIRLEPRIGVKKELERLRRALKP